MKHNSVKNRFVLDHSPRFTYISLFSGAGIGCYGFKLEKFECIATNEINTKRLKFQKINNKCRYESGYVAGDIVKQEIKNRIRQEYQFWRSKHQIKDLDLIIATPPCQGMSVANHKKKNELGRNSLVVESIKFVKEFKPKFFLFENVRSFLKSICTDSDGRDKYIHKSIETNLAGFYNIEYRIVNFKDYGNPSSRTRTLVIGVRKDLDEITPIDFMPSKQRSRSVREVIGDLPPLNIMGEVWQDDIYHHFRSYSEHMRLWIENLLEGESAFDNANPKLQPHRIVNGEVIMNARKNGDKYTRSFWDKPGPCIHTRNDILSSQTTIHPTDDRVFSIRELMHLMSIPDSFKWTEIHENDLNQLSKIEKRKFLKQEELNIRQSIGESVPTVIFHQIAKQIKNKVVTHQIEDRLVNESVEELSLQEPTKLNQYVTLNPRNLSFVGLSKVVEKLNPKRSKLSAYYTRQDICFTIVSQLPDASKFTSLRILEPSVGTGNFLPLLIEKYKLVPNLEIDVIDIDGDALSILKSLTNKLELPTNITINFINDDFLLFEIENWKRRGKPYDIIVGNPPFGKIVNRNELLREYKKQVAHTRSNNIFSFFLEKATHIADHVALILPKSFLSAPEFNELRNFVSKYSIKKIVDFGEKGFKGVRIETIGLLLEARPATCKNKVAVESYITNEKKYKSQEYICSTEYPYWLIYRDDNFDISASKLHFDVFSVVRDRQITKKITKSKGKFRVLKSRNIGSNSIVDIPNYDSYVDDYGNLSIGKFINNHDAVLVPNLTYYPRACFLPMNTIFDGSVAVLIPKSDSYKITEEDLEFYNSDEFTHFYRIARNFGTRSLNIDKNSVFFFGLSKTKFNQSQLS